MANLINSPPNGPITGGDGNVMAGYRNYFVQVFTICAALTQSGTTAQRPTKFLWDGRMYADKTLSKPVWWINAAWRDAAGAPA